MACHITSRVMSRENKNQKKKKRVWLGSDWEDILMTGYVSIVYKLCRHRNETVKDGRDYVSQRKILLLDV